MPSTTYAAWDVATSPPRRCRNGEGGCCAAVGGFGWMMGLKHVFLGGGGDADENDAKRYIYIYTEIMI